MNGNQNGVKEFSPEELEALFKDDEQTPPPASTETTPPGTPPADGDKPTEDETKAFAKRLKEATDKKVAETKEAVAKEAGYTSYEEMVKSKEKKIIIDKGLNPDDVSPVIDELVKSRLDQDPRMKELEELRKQKIKDFATKELAEITKLTGGEITKLEQIPKEVVELWKTTGSLKSAFLQIKGEELIIKATAATSKGSTDHLKSPGGSNPPITKTRPLTEQEKRDYKYFNPNITDEELNKKTYQVD